MGEWIKSLLVRCFKFNLNLINKKTNPLIITGNITTKKVNLTPHPKPIKNEDRSKFFYNSSSSTQQL